MSKTPEQTALDIVASNDGGDGICRCDVAYTSRGRTDPYCRWCNFGKGCVEDITKALREYGNARLEECAWLMEQDPTGRMDGAGAARVLRALKEPV